MTSVWYANPKISKKSQLNAENLRPWSRLFNPRYAPDHPQPMATAVEHATAWPDPDSLYNPWEPLEEEINVPEVFKKILPDNKITQRLAFQDPAGRFVHKTLLEECTASPEPLQIGIIGLDHNYTSSPGDAKDVESLRGLGHSVLFRKVGLQMLLPNRQSGILRMGCCCCCCCWWWF